MQDLRTRRIVTAMTIMVVAALLGVAPALAATDVRPIIVPGESTPIQGVAQQLPPLSATGFYSAGSGFVDEIRSYRTSGQYVQDQRAVVTSAEKFLRKWLTRTCGDTLQEMGEPAVVFDVDDTLLDWYVLCSQSDFNMSYAQWLTYGVECDMPAIGAAKALFKTAKNSEPPCSSLPAAKMRSEV